MAATHLTLEEAADRLGISPEEFKKRLKTHPAFKTLVPIRDGSTLRFKESAIEELARELGAGSNPENPLPPAKKAADEPLKFADEGSEVFSLSADESKPPAKKGSDSDVRLDAEKPKSGKIAKNTGGEAVATEEISIDFSGPGSAVIKGGSSSKLSAPKSSGKLTSDSGKSLAKPGTGDSSEFELSLDADSDDFELKLNTDSSDEVALGQMPPEKDATGSSGRRAGQSGILARSPSDSGISLEKKEPKDDSSAGGRTDSDSDLDFELTLDSSSAVAGPKIGGVKGKKDDSDSEFELTLDDSSGGAPIDEEQLSVLGSGEKGDIFETDFEIPPMGESDSGSEAVALESSDTDLEKSDFDVAVDESADATPESGSEVVLLEEEEGKPKAKKGKPAKKAAKQAEDVDLAEVEEEEEEEEASASRALKGARARREEEEEEEAVPAGAAIYRPVPWGPIPVIFLLPAFVFMLVGAIMGYEIIQTTTGYQQPKKPAAPLVRAIAGTLDMEPTGQ